MDFMEEEKDPEIISRKGYMLKDLARAFQVALGESGPISTGKLMHYTADMVCSGGLQLWEKLCWDYAYEHIGVASPRIFHYLFRKFKEINGESVKVAFDMFCRKKEVQECCMEIVLILQNCPKKSKCKMPSVPAETHENDDWLRSVLRTTDKAAVRKVWQRNTDLEQMLHAGNEMVFAITEGATERALFWVKWLLEEDAIVRKRFGQGLTTLERGPASASVKTKASVGYYIINICSEVYKEFAEKGMVRMHEEFQTLLDVYRSGDTGQKRKIDTIGLMIQILTDVPRMKVPAAPTLVPDPAGLARALEQAEGFFREVLALPVLQKKLPATVTGLKQRKQKEMSKEDQLQKKLNAIDQATMKYYKF